MPEHPLKAAIATSVLTRALKDGSIQPNGVDLEYPAVDWIAPAMRRMVRETKYDIAEMALGTYLCAKAFNCPFIAIPIFLTRNFHHTAIVYNVHSGIRSPKDLEGRNVAINRGYTVTTGLWARGMLQSEYGVNLKKITCFPTDDEHVEEYQAPLNVDYKYQRGRCNKVVALWKG
jgi:4,5-dihydroxyphthalate decarboxylase